MTRDIYEIDDKLERAMQLCRDELSSRNYSSIRRYIEYCRARRIRPVGLLKMIYNLKELGLIADAPLADLDENGIVRVMSEINSRNYAHTTKNDYAAILRMYYKFTLRNKKSKKILKFATEFLKKKAGSEIREPAHILQPDDILRMLLACKTNEMRAILYLLWETGARIGELLNLKHNDIKFDQNGAIVRLDGKTGVRYVRIVESVAILNSHIVQAFFKKEYVFGYKYAAFKKQLNILRDQLGYKELYPHLFRKSRACYLAKFMTEQQLKKYMGWTVGSRVLQHYIFLTCDDANEAILKLHEKEIPQRNFGENKLIEFAAVTLH